MRYDLSSGLIFLQRLGVIQAERMPLPAFDGRALTVHQLSLQDITPIPEQLGQYDGDPPPDRGQTYEWPPQL